MPIVPVVAFLAHREWLSAAQLDALIEPYLGNPVTQDRIVIIGHLELSVRSVERMSHKIHEVGGLGAVKYRAVPEPGERRADPDIGSTAHLYLTQGGGKVLKRR